MTKNPKLSELLLVFFKIGAFTFGGGYAMISIIESEIVNKRAWLTKDSFLDALTIAQTSPGILAVNISIIVGNMFFGKKGAILCTLSTCLPAFFTILIIATFFAKFQDNQTIKNIFRGIRPVVVALIALPVFSLWQKARIGLKTFYIPILVVVLICTFGISPILIIISTIIFSILYCYVTSIRKNQS